MVANRRRCPRPIFPWCRLVTAEVAKMVIGNDSRGSIHYDGKGVVFRIEIYSR